MTAHERPYIITESAVPLCPTMMSGKAPYLVQASCIPGLCNNFGVGKNRVFGNHFHHGWIGQHLATGIPAKDGGQVKAEAIHMHFNDPPVESVDNEATNNGVIAVAGVAAARKVEIGPGPGIKQIVNGIVYSPEASRRPVNAPFGSMVVDNI